MITYSWEINPLDCIIAEDGMTNIVQTVHWRYNGVDEKGTTSGLYGAQSFPTPSSQGFVPFNQLTNEIVAGWLTSVLDVPAMEAQIAESIYLINNPVMVQLNLPNTPVVENTI
jgi:hypothetical protein